MHRSSALIGLAVVVGLTSPGYGKDTGRVFVSSEKSGTVTVLNRNDAPVTAITPCKRPRGMRFNRERTGLFIACGDDDMIALYGVATLKPIRLYRGISNPETFDLDPAGTHLYISNEDDAEVTVLDLQTGIVVAHYPTGEEPEGVLVSPDGKLAFVAAEAADLVHVIDVARGLELKPIITDTRPRRFALTPDRKQLWVSCEIAGVVDIIDLTTFEIVGRLGFLPPGLRREQVTPVDIVMNKAGTRAYVSLGRANHVAVVDVASREVLAYILVGKRPWGLGLTSDEKKLYVADGLSDDIVLIDTESNTPVISIPVGQ